MHKSNFPNHHPEKGLSHLGHISYNKKFEKDK